MVLILFSSYKRIISYDRAKLKKVGEFSALTWLIFSGPVTYIICHMFKSPLKLCSSLKASVQKHPIALLIFYPQITSV